MLWAATSRITFERGVAAAHLSAAEVLSKFECDRLFELMGSPRLEGSAQIDRLVSRGLILDDLQGGFDVTNLLALTCARDLSGFPQLARKSLRVIKYKGTSKIVGEDDTQGKRGFEVSFPRFLKYIMDRVEHREEMRHGSRVTVYAIPEIAVRELVANALIHQDLTSLSGGPTVEIFSDRITITNPGEPLMDPHRMIDAPPKSRNELLAGLMRELAHCEERGSGVDRAIDSVEKHVCPPPLFQAVEGSTVATLYSSRSFASLTKDERIRACYQHASLRFEAGTPMSNASLRARFGLSDRQYPQVSAVIKDAIDAGEIRPLAEDQGNRNARYVPAWA